MRRISTSDFWVLAKEAIEVFELVWKILLVHLKTVAVFRPTRITIHLPYREALVRGDSRVWFTASVPSDLESDYALFDWASDGRHRLPPISLAAVPGTTSAWLVVP